MRRWCRERWCREILTPDGLANIDGHPESADGLTLLDRTPLSTDPWCGSPLVTYKGTVCR